MIVNPTHKGWFETFLADWTEFLTAPHAVCWFWSQPLSVFIYVCFADWVLHIIAHFGFASYSKSRVWSHQQTSQILERTISWVNSGVIPPWFTQHQKPMAVEMWLGCFYQEYSDAIQEGDGGRVLHCWKYMIYWLYIYSNDDSIPILEWK